MAPPLDGLLVADFSRVLAGTLATMFLADLGATVVKVERPGAGASGSNDFFGDGIDALSPFDRDHAVGA